MTEEKKIFLDLVTLGSFLKKHRRLKGEKIESVANKLFIKKRIIQSFEEGSFVLDNFNNDSYLKGFLKTYIKYLKLENVCSLELLEQKKRSNLHKSNLRLETKSSKNHTYGSITILGSLILLGIIYLIWNKQTYIQLYLLGTKIN